MSEITEYISNKKQLTEQTKKNYTNQHKTIVKKLGKNINDSTEQEILDAFSELKPNVSKLYLSLAIIVRRHFNNTIDLLELKRNELKDDLNKYIENKKKDTDITLPSLKQVTDYTNDLYKEKEYVKFIINYLLINYGTRNKDVDVFVTDDAKNIKDPINYIVVGNNTATWYVNDYKTLKLHGAKKFIIKAKKFIDAIKQIPNNTWLLSTNGEHISNTGLATTLKRMLFNNLTEGTYFKIIMKHINSQPNSINLLQFYSQSRGTNYQALLQYYNTDQNKDIKINSEDDEI